MRIEARFAWIIAVYFCFGLLIVGYSSYWLENRQTHEEIKLKAEMLIDTASAVRNYTADELVVISQLQDSEFHPQQVPSFSAQNVLGRVTKKYSGYTYRETSLNPTNLKDRANDWEVGLLHTFQDDAQRRELSGITGSASDSSFYVARPIRLTSAACMQCHSIPAVAPAAMVARYGLNNGFGWKINEVVGMQIVKVPMAPILSKALNSVFLTVALLTSVFVLFAVVVIIFLRRYVSLPLNALTVAATRSSMAPHDSGYVEPEIGGQFGELQLAIQRLRISVFKALRMLEQRNSNPIQDEKECRNVDPD